MLYAPSLFALGLNLHKSHVGVTPFCVVIGVLVLYL